ncbi:hypothetical protein ACOSQ3_002497 [Xanthoceras sorbifolium]
MTFYCETNEMHVEFDPMPHEYLVKIGIPTRVFTSTVKLLANSMGDTVSIVVSDMKVKFTTGNLELVLSNKRNDCIVEGIRGKDTNEYIAKFSSKCLLSWDDSIRRTSRVWIYPSYCNGLPSVLKCPV